MRAMGEGKSGLGLVVEVEKSEALGSGVSAALLLGAIVGRVV